MSDTPATDDSRAGTRAHKTTRRSTSALGAVVFVLVAYVGFDVYTRGVAGAASPKPSAVQVVCYGQSGQPLFPPQIAHSAKFGDADAPIELTYENGMHAWIRASSCIAAQMTGDDLAALRATAATKTPPPSAAPSKPPAELERAAESYQAEHAKLIKPPAP